MSEFIEGDHVLKSEEEEGTADLEDLRDLKLDNDAHDEEGERLIDGNSPLHVTYCPNCSMPPEYCEYNVPEVFEKCLPWIIANCPHVLSKSVRAKVLGEELVEGEGDEENEKSKKRSGAGAKKKASTVTTRVVIARIQRQKRKFVTVIAGLESVPELKIKEACKAFGKKFSSGNPSISL